MTKRNRIQSGHYFLPFLPFFGLFLSLLSCGGAYTPAQRGHSYGPAREGNDRAQRPQSNGSYATSTASVGESQSGQGYDRGARSESADQNSESVFAPTPSEPSRPGLGTTFGEHRESSVVHRRFERSGSQPFAQVAIFYNDLEGVQEQSWFRGQRLRELRARTQSGGLSISLVDSEENVLPGGISGNRTYVVGRDGQRYSLHIRNDTGGRFEVVASVDGLDVVDGEPASFDKRGYVIAPYSELVIDGFRTSMESVAAFRFGSVRDSYAGQTSGDRNVGVIGFAFFAERGSRYQRDELLRRESADPFPGQFATPPGMAN